MDDGLTASRSPIDPPDGRGVGRHLTIESYTALSPCGWYLPSTSPTTVALFLYARPGLSPASLMAYRIRRWTGFSPSLRVRISTDGGLGPLWAKSGAELFFVDEERRLLAALFDSDSGQPGRPEPLFAIPADYQANVSNNFYDVTRDGERFLMARRLAGDSQGEAYIVTNWFTELRERMGTP